MQRLILRTAGFVVRVFYRHVHVGGSVPASGPLLLVGNHPNGLVDPIVLSWTTDRPLRFLGKAPLFEMPVIGLLAKGLEALPVYRAQDEDDTNANERTFEAVYAALAKGDLVCLFPEGRSHDEPTLQRLKTGAARMALGAEERAGHTLGCGVVPVGLVYRAKHRFRSRVATWVGAPIELRDLAELHRSDPWAAVQELTQRIAAGLQAVTLELDHWEDLPLLELAERMEPKRPTDARATGAGVSLPRLRAFAQGLRVLRARDPKRIEDCVQRVADFRARLAALGIGIGDLDQHYSARGVTRFVLRNLFWLLLGFPLAALGYALYVLPYWGARVLGARIKTSRDVYATIHILAGTVFILSWSLLLLTATALSFGWPWALFLFVLLLPTGLAALAFHDWRRRVLADVRAFFRLGTRERLREELVRERDALGHELEALRHELERSQPGADASAEAPPAG